MVRYTAQQARGLEKLFKALSSCLEFLVPCFATPCVEIKIISAVVLFVRQAEFGRACLQTLLTGASPQVHYLGLVKDKHYTELRTAFESEIYKMWGLRCELVPAQDQATNCFQSIGSPDIGA